ncbi:MAG: PilZ domain-containing protein [Myxococcota bacterium]
MPRADSLFRIDVLDDKAPLYAQDVSLGGLYTTSADCRWPGTLMPLRFVLPSSRRAVRLTARVVALHDEPSGVGMSLQFVRLSADAALELHAFIDARPIVAKNDRIAAQVDAWLGRITDDCDELLAFSRA